jgi:hypothetical protein
MAITRNPEIPGQVQVLSLIQLSSIVDGHTLTCVTEGDCLGYNKTGFRDNLGLMPIISGNYLKAVYFSYINQ